MIRTAAVLAFVSNVTVVSAQVSVEQPAPAFEVASVKATRQSSSGIMRRPTPGRVFFQNVPLQSLVEEAFDVEPYQVVGLPSWTVTERFGIEATYDPAMAKQVPAMLQRLLEERFRLRVRRETRDMPVYEMVKARSDGTLGPGLRPSTTDCAPAAGQRSSCTLRIASNSIEATGTRWGFLPTNIGVWDRPVIDKTGLSGSFDVKLDWTPDPAVSGSAEAAAAAATAAASTPNRVSIFTALQEQLGLKLEPSRAPVEVLVIDSVQRPTTD